jgi:hypothetical protein
LNVQTQSATTETANRKPASESRMKLKSGFMAAVIMRAKRAAEFLRQT